jgi:CheY-like chemotaxis protein
MMPPRILIAEDDDIQGSVLRAALLRQGYEADVVPDGLQALRRLRTGTYDLALLDYFDRVELDSIRIPHGGMAFRCVLKRD